MDIQKLQCIKFRAIAMAIRSFEQFLLLVSSSRALLLLIAVYLCAHCRVLKRGDYETGNYKLAKLS